MLLLLVVVLLSSILFTYLSTLSSRLATFSSRSLNGKKKKNSIYLIGTRVEVLFSTGWGTNEVENIFPHTHLGAEC